MLSLSQRGFRRPYKSYTPPADLDEVFVATCAKTLPELSTGADLSKIRLEGECKAFKLSNQKFGCKFFLQFLADFSQNKLFGSPWWCWQPFSVLLETFGTPKLWFKSKQLKSVFIGRDFSQSNDTVSKTFISLSGDNKARVLNALSKAVGGHDVPNSLVHTIDSLDKALTFYR